VRAVLAVFLAALTIAAAKATMYTTQEKIDQHRAKLASWDSLDGERPAIS
jgi:hypothetical protein